MFWLKFSSWDLGHYVIWLLFWCMWVFGSVFGKHIRVCTKKGSIVFVFWCLWDDVWIDYATFQCGDDVCFLKNIRVCIEKLYLFFVFLMFFFYVATIFAFCCFFLKLTVFNDVWIYCAHFECYRLINCCFSMSFFYHLNKNI